MRTALILLALTVSAAAQTGKGDRLPIADPDAPRVVRTIPIVPSEIERRWPGGGQRWLGNRPPPSDRFEPSDGRSVQVTVENAPAVNSVVPVPIPRAVEKVRPQHAVWRVEDVCARHGMRKVYTDNHRWRCRR